MRKLVDSNVISGYTELLLPELAAQTGMRRKAEKILDAARRAGDLVAQLLAFPNNGPALEPTVPLIQKPFMLWKLGLLVGQVINSERMVI